MLQLVCRSCSVPLYFMVITVNITATSGMEVNLYTEVDGDIFWHFYHLQATSLYIYINLKGLTHASLKAVICFIQSGL